MQILTLTFPFPINDSVQVGDWVYYTPLTTIGTVSPFEKQDSLANVVQLGPIVAFGTGNAIDVMWDDANISAPAVDDFILFGKNKTVNTSSLIGYYADIKFVNNSTEKAELFAVGSDVFESSK